MAADSAAAAFEALREEVALVRRAVAGLAAERASIDIPDYSETLGKILQAIVATAQRLTTLNEAPALQMSADNWAREIADAGEAARCRDEAALSGAQTALRDMTENLRGWIDSARDAERQNTWLRVTGAAGLVMGAIVGAMIAMSLISATPEKQGSPEQQAASILGMSEEKAGEHLIQSASPQLLQDLVFGDRIVVANREELQRCLRQAHGYRRKTERCVVELPDDMAGQ